jgi:hypothetical protein
MPKTVFSSALFEQIGGSSWVTRRGYFSEQSVAQKSIEDSALQQSPQDAHVDIDNDADNIRQDALINENALVESHENYAEEESAQSSMQFEQPDLKSLTHIENAVVLIGAGLENIWQDEENLAWQLWQNIMKAFAWDESQVVFFDTELLVTEEAIFATMEEVIDLGVEWVLTMDDVHELSEQLAEGVHVVSVPEFESMLSDPYSKQSFYHSVISLGMPS